jgi:hypothetical protein
METTWSFQPASKAQERLLVLSNAFGNNKRNVVVLFTRAESPYLIHDCRQQFPRRQVPMPPKCFDEALFSKLFFG